MKRDVVVVILFSCVKINLEVILFLVLIKRSTNGIVVSEALLSTFYELI